MTVTGRPARPGRSAGRLRLRDTPMILMYHAVAEVAEDPNLLCVTPRRFAEQMAWLERHGLRGVSVGDADRRDAGGDQPRARRHHLRRRVHERAGVGPARTGPPGLHGERLRHLRPDRRDQRVGRGAVLAPAVGQPGQGPRRAGLEIGSHGATHVRLAGLSPARTGRGGRREQGRPDRDRRHADPGLRLPVRLDGRAGQAGGARGGLRLRLRRRDATPDLGLAALPRIYVGQRDNPGRLAAKRLLYRGYIAVKGRRG